MNKSMKKSSKTVALLLTGCLVGSTMFGNTPFVLAESNAENITQQVGGQLIPSSTEVVISSEQMDVLVDRDFPRVIEYQLKKGAGAGKTFLGQKEKLDQILINDVAVKPTVKSSISGNKVVYEMTLKDESKKIDAVITAELVVKDNMLEFNITKIIDNQIVKTIEIPNHNLISVNSSQPNAMLDGAQMSTNTHINGDRHVKVDEKLDMNKEKMSGYMYAILSNDDLSASMWSNTENNLAKVKEGQVSGSALRDAQRITASATENADGEKTIGLSSTVWTYQKSEDHRKEDGTLELEDGTVNKVDEMPRAKVVITGDANDDKDIDWQDGAIASRDIINTPLGSEKVPDLVGYRVNMNFGGQAQNPFLMALDGVKKFSLNTDGLGQSILLKGYGSEGHDSGHLNYADIGTRIGGAKDMKTLLEKGKEYGATFGVHVNASETYPESKYFEENRLLKNADGSYKYGWNWIDQGINIDADYDLRNGRGQRFKDFYDVLGGANNDLDFIYVDVWGNGQSGDNSSWPSRQLTKEINSLGWRMASEWGYANEYDSTFQHWAADLTYGGYTLKGINSTITRFIRNHQKDSWNGNYPRYGGDADAPLLGGYSMKDFEGWQGRSDYKAYMDNLFAVNLPAKFNQHFKVMDWEDGEAVQMSDNNETYNWVPGMKAVLQDDAENTLVIERQSNDFANDKDGYRTRTMTFNDKKIFEGQPGEEKYLIPWLWDESGNELSTSEEKLYHWNTKGGQTTWEVPAGWSGTVKVYELTELGKENEKDVVINNGKITLDAKEKTAYVVHKTKSTNQDVKWSDGMHVVDTGFNSASLKDWAVSGDKEAATITKSEGNNNMLTIKDNKEKVTVTQKITGLKPNTQYAAYVGIDNRSEKEAGITVKAAGKQSKNATGKSIAKNYVRAYAHNTLGTEQAKNDGQMTSTVDGTSYFQHMYVTFTTGEDATDATISLTREPGAGASYFDDIRIVENNANNFVSNTKFVQDFENVVQGIYPFVISDIEGVEDNRTHLAELNAPYTQRGWNQKTVNDVIEGKWSVKTNGLTEYQKLVYQTIPQNFKFKPGVTYKITFDYEAGSDDTYAVVTGNAPYGEADFLTQDGLKSTGNPDKNATHGQYSFTMKGDESGQSWFGIYSTSTPADTKGVTGSQANFNGYMDFMLDNLVIEALDDTQAEMKTQVEQLVLEGKELLKDTTGKSESAIEKLTVAITAAEEAIADDKSYEELKAASEQLTAAIEVYKNDKLPDVDDSQEKMKEQTKQLVLEAKELLKDTTGKSESAIEKLTAAITAAEEAIADDKSYEELKAAFDQLTEAIEVYKNDKLPDVDDSQEKMKEQTKQLVLEAKELLKDTTGKSESAIEKLTAAITAAEEAIADDKSYEELKAAFDQLTAAIEVYKNDKLPGEDPDKKPDGDGNGSGTKPDGDNNGSGTKPDQKPDGDTNGNNPGSDKNPYTGDNAPVAGMVIALLAGVAGVFGLRKWKKAE